MRTGTPIFAEESLLDEVGQEQDETEPASEGDQDELIEDFRDFIENVKPEDFERRLTRPETARLANCVGSAPEMARS